MSCPAIAIQGKDLVFTVQFHDGTGTACDATGAVSYAIYEDEAATPILTGTMAKLAAQTGFYSELIAATIANGFETFKTYTIRIAATIAGVAVVAPPYSFICLGMEAVAGSESTGLICTLADVKDRLGLGNENDSVITRIITSIEGIFNTETRRNLIVTEEDVTEYFTPEGNYLQLERYPIVNITSIKYAPDYDFDNADALEENVDYRSMNKGKNGIIYLPGKLTSFPDSLQIIHRGGYCSAGQTPGEGEFAMDAGLRELAIQQSSFIFKRKDDIGLSSVSAQGGSISTFNDMELLPLVKNQLEKYYRRPSL